MATEQHNTQAKKFTLPRIMVMLGLGILLLGEVYCGYRLQSLSSERKQVKEDYSTVNNITFGLFSVDQWRDKIVAVVNRQVQAYNMTPEQKKQLQAEVEQELHQLVNKAVASINKPQKSLSGKLKKLAFKAMVNTDDIQAQVPSFARTIIDKVNSPASKTRLKNIATSKVEQLEKQTYDNTEESNDTVTSIIYRRYHVTDAAGFNRQVNSRLSVIKSTAYAYLAVTFVCILLALGFWWLLRKQAHLQAIFFVMVLLFAFVLLIVGITSSIIEVDARVQTLNFMLMGERVAFNNQVLFFQSKSIIGIVSVLLRQPKPDAVVVGALIFIFIIVLPILRLIAKGVHMLCSAAFAKNKVFKYLAFDAAKWDMADVMIVGILMTYIGLTGIIKSQLSNLNIHNSFLTAVTGNYSTLQPGYFVFAGYVLLALALSHVLKRVTPHGG